MFPRVRLALLLLSALTACVLADYGPRDSVTILTDKNFEKEVLQSPDYWLVEFYAPWCGHCKQLEPQYKAAAKKLKKHARLGAVDATVHQQLAHKYQIKGYPTIKEFGAKKKRPQDYRGGRTTREIVQYVKNSPEAKKLGASGGNVATLEYDKVHAFLSKDLPSAIFFGTKKKGKKSSKVPAWLGNVAKSFMEGTTKKRKKQPTVQLAFVPASDDKVASHFGLSEDQLPTVIYVYPASQKYVVSDVSKLNEAAAKKFIDDALANTETAENDESLPNVPLFPSPEVAKKKPVVALKELDAATARECAAKRGKMCVVVAREDTELIRSLAKKYRRDPFTFLSSKPDAQAFHVLTEFVGEISAEVIVVKPGRKVKYSALSGANDESDISEFLDKLIGGSSPFSVPSGGLEAFEAAMSASSDDAVKHEEL
ncbi:protein disulfide-isomerase, putative [Phytophthora infestans T30-4]|uniref:Protein disulfide-isomerase, putative n=1 Tax=Phytophthora infestans (strain T30-4) TaxID=403677 RepID=D0N9Y6_PHYIT|nr:protein disulfide-isomerase, putative [Phytophthora infestans T30-4]EEY54240.1 protein disulfide-isomerase, putative [Phytophthora infestans T30-4]|eukprot:XP_002904062.1 protein disulfide-isomerase, putative [Phytophthora infestans T30-4]